MYAKLGDGNSDCGAGVWMQSRRVVELKRLGCMCGTGADDCFVCRVGTLTYIQVV